jgi:hypothetical protein
MSAARPGRRYEVWVQREKRWVIDCLAATEVDALARVEELYADERNDAVKVLRAHFNAGGASFESVVTERVREARRGLAPLRLAASPDEEAWCETLADLYGPSSRRAMARLLRNFLDRFQITPTELLHQHRWIKQLDNQETLLPSAIQRMAAIQAEQHKLDRRVRSDAIDKFVNEATNRARDALASRAAPRLGDGGLVALVATVAERAKDPFEQAFWQRHAIARAFEDITSFAAKFERLMSWVTEDFPPSLLPLIDELCAGFMGAVSMIKDTLGNQPNLGGALDTLADLAAGRQKPELAGAPPGFATFARLMSAAAMPETRSVLYERLQRELATDKPFSREATTTQRRQFETLIDKITDDAGIFAGGPAMVTAIARRSRRFDIVGGAEEIRFKTTEPATQIEELLDAQKRLLARRQQQAIGTYLRATIDRLDAEATALDTLRSKLAATDLPDVLKKALLARIPGPKNAN